MSPFGRFVRLFSHPSNRSVAAPRGALPLSTFNALWTCKTAQPFLQFSSAGAWLHVSPDPTQNAFLLVWERMGSSLGFLTSLFGNMLRARDITDFSNTRNIGYGRMLPHLPKRRRQAPGYSRGYFTYLGASPWSHGSYWLAKRTRSRMGG